MTSKSRELEVKQPKNPLLDKYNRTVSELIKQKKEPTEDLEKLIAKKYHVTKWEAKSADGDFEVWEYNKDSVQKPILEDQALKRVQSLIAAAKHIFEKENRKNNFAEDFNYLEKIFLEKMLFEKEFTVKKAKGLIKQVMNDIAYLWKKGHATPDKLDKDDFKNFYKRLFEEVELPPFAAYKTKNILVLNTDPGVRSVQIYERGTTPLDPRERKVGTKSYLSSHKRDQAGLTNFVAYGAGNLDLKGNAQITDIGFRNASFAPYDLYAKDDPLNATKTIDVTTNTMEALFQEAQTRMEKKPTSAAPLHGVYVGLMTVHSNEDQDRQYRETILAADRMRFKKGYNPIIFDFGINWAAVAKGGLFSTYPADQRFENERAFFQLQMLFLKNLGEIDKRLSADPSAKKVKDFLRDIKKAIEKVVIDYLTIEASLTPLIAKYDELVAKISPVVDSYNSLIETYKKLKADKDRKDTGELKALEENIRTIQEERLKPLKQDLDKVEKELQNTKRAAYVQSHKLTKEFQERYSKEISSKLKELTEKEKFNENDMSIIYMLVDHNLINFYMTDDRWCLPDNNIKLQTYIVDCVNRLGNFTDIFSSFGCKSNNDRGSALAVNLDGMRAKRLLGDKNFDPKKHCSGAAWVQNPVIDTDGGGPKFGNGFLDYGHPNKTFAGLQNKTSGLATHKFAHKYIKAAPIPVKPMLLTESVGKKLDPLSEVKDLDLQPKVKGLDLQPEVKDFAKSTEKKLDQGRVKFLNSPIKELMLQLEALKLEYKEVFYQTGFLAIETILRGLNDLSSSDMKNLLYSESFKNCFEDADKAFNWGDPVRGHNLMVKIGIMLAPLLKEVFIEPALKHPNSRRHIGLEKEVKDCDVRYEILDKQLGVKGPLFSSSLTDAVKTAYKSYLDKPSYILPVHIQQLNTVLDAVDKWLDHEYSRASKVLSKKNAAAEATIRGRSITVVAKAELAQNLTAADLSPQFPLMLALREFLLKKMQQVINVKNFQDVAILVAGHKPVRP